MFLVVLAGLLAVGLCVGGGLAGYVGWFVPLQEMAQRKTTADTSWTGAGAPRSGPAIGPHKVQGWRDLTGGCPTNSDR
ncbi:hypothetical protein [Micromonospora purpureochromogenes]|uniref:hypothetical protein n=1 Tax=Micromonospora purpureochromogenes TaxID=47872 RepID=UPI0015611861|nr:hypothetical protein [Micromonospora purpureochromogenes]